MSYKLNVDQYEKLARDLREAGEEWEKNRKKEHRMLSMGEINYEYALRDAASAIESLLNYCKENNKE